MVYSLTLKLAELLASKNYSPKDTLSRKNSPITEIHFVDGQKKLSKNKMIGNAQVKYFLKTLREKIDAHKKSIIRIIIAVNFGEKEIDLFRRKLSDACNFDGIKLQVPENDDFDDENENDKIFEEYPLKHENRTHSTRENNFDVLEIASEKSSEKGEKNVEMILNEIKAKRDNSKSQENMDDDNENDANSTEINKQNDLTEISANIGNPANDVGESLCAQQPIQSKLAKAFSGRTGRKEGGKISKHNNSGIETDKKKSVAKAEKIRIKSAKSKKQSISKKKSFEEMVLNSFIKSLKSAKKNSEIGRFFFVIFLTQNGKILISPF